jgi:hypothetical protein
MATTDIYSVMGSLLPFRHCVRFLGGDVDDGIQIDAAAVAAVTGNHTKGTITAWIMIPDIAGTYTIFGAGDADVAEYMEFKIVAGKVNFKVYDGGAARVDVSTTSVVLKKHQWHHVAVVQNGETPKIYVDGESKALTYATSTEITQWFDDTDGIDGAHIGASDSIAGGALLTNEFTGYISDFHLYTGTAAGAALTAEEIKQDMSGASVQTTYLQNSYTMDGNVTDAGTGADNGTIVGALIYCDGCEFTSRFSFGCGIAVVADGVQISINNNLGIATVIQAA